MTKLMKLAVLSIAAVGICTGISLTARACPYSCHHFSRAVANVKPLTKPYGTYCLDFLGNYDRGGTIYKSTLGKPSKDGRQADPCDVYKPTDCSGLCAAYNPRVTPGLDVYAQKVDTASIYRYECQDGGYEDD